MQIKELRGDSNQVSALQPIQTEKIIIMEGECWVLGFKDFARAEDQTPVSSYSASCHSHELIDPKIETYQ